MTRNENIPIHTMCETSLNKPQIPPNGQAVNAQPPKIARVITGEAKAVSEQLDFLERREPIDDLRGESLLLVDDANHAV